MSLSDKQKDFCAKRVIFMRQRRRENDLFAAMNAEVPVERRILRSVASCGNHAGHDSTSLGKQLELFSVYGTTSYQSAVFTSMPLGLKTLYIDTYENSTASPDKGQDQK